MEVLKPLKRIRKAVRRIYKEATRYKPVRRRGPAPMMDDVTFLSLEILGEMLGFNGDKAIWEYLKWHWTCRYPNLPAYKTFAHQSKRLQEIKELMFKHLFRLRNGRAIMDSLPLPTAKWPRAKKSKMLRGHVGWGYKASTQETYYGFKGHVAVRENGLVGTFLITSANKHDLVGLKTFLGVFEGMALADRGYLSKEHKELLAEYGIDLQTPLRKNMKEDRDPAFLDWMRRTRKKIECVFSTLVRKFSITRIKAHTVDQYMSKLTRKLLAYNFSVLLKRA